MNRAFVGDELFHSESLISKCLGLAMWMDCNIGVVGQIIIINLSHPVFEAEEKPMQEAMK